MTDRTAAKIITLIVVLALAVSWFAARDARIRHRAAADAMAAAYQLQVDSLKVELQTKDFELDQAMDRETAARASYEQARLSVGADTVIRWRTVPAGAPPKADTLFVVPPGYVKAADELSLSCGLLKTSCEEYRVTAEAASAAKDRVIEQLRGANKSQPFRIRDVLLGAAASATVCYVAR